MTEETPENELGNVVADTPPPPPTLCSAVCRTPDEFLAYWRSIHSPTYAIKIYDDTNDQQNDIWFFANDIQDAAAIGIRWHKRDCALEQYPVAQEDEIVYGYRIKNLTHNRALMDLLYEGHLWEKIGADQNAKATPEIMTRLRKELFKFLLTWSDANLFMVLDFSQPDGEAEFFKDWADEELER